MVKNMFDNLFDLSVKRTGLQAFAFYIVYMLLGLAVSIVIIIAICVLYCFCNSEACAANGSEIGKQIGTVTGCILVFLYCSGLSALILSVKRLWTNVLALILFIISLPLSIIGGCVLGLIPVAVLTTLENKNSL